MQHVYDCLSKIIQKLKIKQFPNRGHKNISNPVFISIIPSWFYINCYPLFLDFTNNFPIIFAIIESAETISLLHKQYPGIMHRRNPSSLVKLQCIIVAFNQNAYWRKPIPLCNSVVSNRMEYIDNNNRRECSHYCGEISEIRRFCVVRKPGNLHRVTMGKG